METNSPSSAVPTDPFDVRRLALSQDFGAATGVTKALLTVPVRKPDKTWFVRVHPQEDYRLQTAVLEMKEDRETLLVDPTLLSALATELPGMVVPVCLFTAITRQNIVFLWPCRLPSESDRVSAWHRSALDAADMATRVWVSVRANMNLGAYEVFEARNQLSEPAWSDHSFQTLLKLAFKGKFIDSTDHPAIRRLRGEL